MIKLKAIYCEFACNKSHAINCIVYHEYNYIRGYFFRVDKSHGIERLSTCSTEVA